MSGVEAMVKRAEKDLGLGEPNYIQEWYPGLSGNFPWCDSAVTYWAWHSGNQGAVCFGGYYAYTVAHAERFRTAGRWHSDIAGIRRGDIVFFDWDYSNSIGAIDHVGIVTSVSGGNVYTIEGNISNQCLRKVRGSSTIAGYGRPAYADAPSSGGGDTSTLPWVSGRTVIAAAKSSSGVSGDSKPDVLLVQKGLSVQVGLNYSSGPGTFGPMTKAAYKKYQESLGYSGSDADGIPGQTSLTKLGSQSGKFRARDF